MNGTLVAHDGEEGPRGRVLVIAGSDSSGGAGLEADQKVIAAHGCYAMTATTALTAQNTTGVADIHYIPPEFVRKQLDCVFKDIRPDVVKTGMLASAPIIEVVAQALTEYKFDKLVVDPVMVATSGAQLLLQDAVKSLRTLLLPRTFLLTPNLPEAQLLLTDAGQEAVEVKNVTDLETIAQRVHELGPKWVLVKGGHIPFKKDGTVAQNEEEKELMVDVLLGDGKVTRIESHYQNSRNTHGTGCSLASAIASNLSRGRSPVEAVRAACQYVEAAIRTAPGFGKGSGPLNHFHSTYTLPFAPGHFLDYLLSRPDVAPAWHDFINHPFVVAMGNGKLPIESFRNYLIQDYLYLVHFARANALAGYKAKNLEDIAAAAKIVVHIEKEMQLHLQYCAGFGISKEQMLQTEEHLACTAYTRFVLDVGQSGDWFGLQLALAACLLGYGVICKQLYNDPVTLREGNAYWTWITNYVADDYVQAMKTGSDLMEKYALLQSPSRIEELVSIFVHAVKMEIGFWEMFPSE